MPVLKGFGTREGDNRESGRATVLIFFPQAMKKIAMSDPKTGQISFRNEPDPHQRAFSLADLRAMQTRLEAGSEIFKFYKQAEKILLDHIESAQVKELARVTDEGTLVDGDFVSDALKA